MVFFLSLRIKWMNQIKMDIMYYLNDMCVLLFGNVFLFLRKLILCVLSSNLKNYKVGGIWFCFSKFLKSVCMCVFKRVDIASDVWEEVKKNPKLFLTA